MASFDPVETGSYRLLLLQDQDAVCDRGDCQLLLTSTLFLGFPIFGIILEQKQLDDPLAPALRRKHGASFHIAVKEAFGTLGFDLAAVMTFWCSFHFSKAEK